jgi:hypothetical protein
MEALFAANPRNLKLPATGRHYFRFARNPSRVDAKRGDHFLTSQLIGTNPANFLETRFSIANG